MAKLRNPHPGETIREELNELGITPYRLAKETGLEETAISQILNGKRRITARTALRLGAFFGTSPEFWLNLQTAYDLEEERRRPAPDKLSVSCTAATGIS
jgi:addiction module HigA family antidote